MKEDCRWVAREFQDIDFGDPRLKARFIKTAERLAAQPLSSINHACENWADAKGAYRLFSNDRVHPEEILSVHASRTLERMALLPRVLVIQDTTFLSLDTHVKTKGLGLIGSHGNLGVIMHSSLALSEQGLPLGLLDQQIWARLDQPKRLARHVYRKIPTEQKESFKWLQGLRESHRRTPTCQIITVADRESDFYDFFMESEKLGTDFLIRACYDRNVQEGLSLREALLAEKVIGVIELDVKQEDEIRKVRLALRVSEITLQPPQKKNKGSCYHPISVWALWAIEEEPLEEKKALEWVLYSSLPIRNFDEAAEKILWYRHRWHIESFHKVLKSGCRIEECRLETVDRLKRYFALTSVIAWRLYWLTHLHRHHPETPASDILAEPEWKGLYCRIHKTKIPPQQIPTAYQVTRWIAQLGGFLARRGDGEPGITTLWRGWQRLRDITEDYLLFSTANTCG